MSVYYYLSREGDDRLFALGKCDPPDAWHLELQLAENRIRGLHWFALPSQEDLVALIYGVVGDTSYCMGCAGYTPSTAAELARRMIAFARGGVVCLREDSSFDFEDDTVIDSRFPSEWTDAGTSEIATTMSMNDPFEKLRELALSITRGDLRRPWSVQTSNSFRRIGTDRGDGDVLCAVTQRSDGHPDLHAAPGVLDYIVAAHPFAILQLIRERDSARHALELNLHRDRLREDAGPTLDAWRRDAPPRGVRCLVTWTGSDGCSPPRIRVASVSPDASPDEERWFSDGECLHHVVAWMPAPEAAPTEDEVRVRTDTAPT